MSKKSHKPSVQNALKSKALREFYEELQNESQRGGVLVGAAFLDELLRQLLASFMIDDASAVNNLLDNPPNSPLGGLSARTQATYCLGLISKEAYDDLNIIRGIRNEFAHSLQGTSFDHPWIVKQCEALKIPNKSGISTEISASDKFLMTVVLLASQIKLHILGISRRNERRQKRPDWEIVEHIGFDEKKV